MVPSMNKSGPASVPCIRLVSDNNNVPNEPSESLTQITRDPSAHEVTGSYAMLLERFVPDLIHCRWPAYHHQVEHHTSQADD